MNSVSFFKNHISSCVRNLIPQLQSNCTIKTMSVALAIFSMGKFHLNYSNSLVAKLTFSLSALTFIAETCKEKKLGPFKDNKLYSLNWYSKSKICILDSFNKRGIASFLSYIRPCLLYVWKGQVIQNKLPNRLLEGTHASKLKNCVWIVLLGPISEEIMCRGFLKERIEDTLRIFQHYVYPIKDNNLKTIANVGQAAIFGLAYSSKEKDLISKISLFTGAAGMGFAHGKMVNLEESLKLCFGYRILINSAFTLKVLFPLFKKTIFG